jgi:SsrA-binding protein
MAKKKQQDKPSSPRITNRRARFEFFIKEKLECGIALTGTEVKSLRGGNARIEEAFARIRDGELWLIGAHIAPYPHAAGKLQHEPDRDRKLLAHKRQIAQIETHVKQKGRTVVPLAVYFKAGWAKVELGLVEGKQQYDKRQGIRERDQQRDMQREMNRRF